MTPWYNHPPKTGLPMLRRLIAARSLRPLALLLAAVVTLVSLVAIVPAEAGAKPPVIPVSLSLAAPPEAGSAATESPASVTLTCTSEPDGKCYWYTGWQFAHRSICFQNNVGVYWNNVTAENAFESGTNTVVFYDHTGYNGGLSCAAAGWAARDILTYTTYSVNDGACSKFTANSAGGVITGNAIIWMNNSPSRPATCVDTLQHRNNAVSQAIGGAIGLSPFTSSTNLTAAVMNRYFANSYNYAGSDDRNALYWLYYYTPITP